MDYAIVWHRLTGQEASKGPRNLTDSPAPVAPIPMVPRGEPCGPRGHVYQMSRRTVPGDVLTVVRVGKVECMGVRFVVPYILCPCVADNNSEMLKCSENVMRAFHESVMRK